MIRISGGNNYEMKRGVLIRHIGIPMYAGNTLITPFKVVWWWPINWFVIGYITAKELLKDIRS